MTYLIQTVSKPQDLILDPFMGSGSTGVAALNHGRNFIGIDSDASYAKLAHERILEVMLDA